MMLPPDGPLLFTPGDSKVTARSVRSIGNASIRSCLKLVLTCVDSTGAVSGVSAVTVIASDMAAGRSSMSTRSVFAAVSTTLRVAVAMPESSNFMV